MAISDCYQSGFDEENGKEINAETCPECTGDIVTDGGEISCTECGLIVNEYRIDHGPAHFRFGDGRDDRERTGAPLTPARHDRGLSTEIGRGVDGKGKPLTGSKRRQLGRLRTQQHRGRWRSKGERNLAHGFGEITRMTAALELPRSIRDQACTLFRRAQEEGLLLGRSIESIAAGSVYAACRCAGVLRTIDEVVDVARADRESVTNAYHVLNRALALKTDTLRPRAYIPQIASDCTMSDPVRERAIELAEIAEAEGLANGRNPAGVAAACLYLAEKERGSGLTQAALADAADVSVPTLRARYQELRDVLD